MVSRRTLLLGSAIGTDTLLTRSALAFSTEELPATSAAGLALSNRCGGKAEHARHAADLRAGLVARHAPPGTTARAVCPICGCPISDKSPAS